MNVLSCCYLVFILLLSCCYFVFVFVFFLVLSLFSSLVNRDVFQTHNDVARQGDKKRDALLCFLCFFARNLVPVSQDIVFIVLLFFFFFPTYIPSTARRHTEPCSLSVHTKQDLRKKTKTKTKTYQVCFLLGGVARFFFFVILNTDNERRRSDHPRGRAVRAYNY
jgi:hypothetical protein